MKTIKVIKIGGNIIDNEEALTAFIKDFSTITGPKVLVHGGGKLATKLAAKMNIPVNMNEGRRITDAETLDIITMVFGGKIIETAEIWAVSQCGRYRALSSVLADPGANYGNSTAILCRFNQGGQPAQSRARRMAGS